MPCDKPDVLTAEEAADLLRLDPAELCRLAAAGRVPGRQFGDNWRFSRLALMRYIEGAESRDALRRACSAAEAATRAKSDLLASVSHEIRTPMTGILGYSDLLLAEEGIERAPASRREALETIKRNGRYILELISDILDLSRIEAGRLEVERIWVSPAEILDSARRLMNVRAREKGLALKCAFISAIPPLVQTDPTRLRQILINLIGNAIKFTERGTILVLVNHEPEADGGPMLDITVMDDGIGMSREQLTRVFRPFVQADISTARTHGGTGLGLSISKRLAVLLGGDIVVHSRPERGSAFRVSIAAGPAGPLRHVEHAGPPSAAEGGVVDTARVADDVLAGRRILLAEDTRTNQVLFERILSLAGAEVAVADNGQVALDLAAAAESRGQPFDIVLTDLHMPVMDGYEAVARLRHDGFAGLVVALTASAAAGDGDDTPLAGCDGFIQKPVDRLTLLRTLRRHLDERATLSDCAGERDGGAGH